MTLEQESFGGDWDYGKKQRFFSRIVQKLGGQTLSGGPYVEQYFQSLHRRSDRKQ